MATNTFEKQKEKASFERLWLQYPKNFDPLKGCMAEDRYKKTLALVDEKLSTCQGKVLDLACGCGNFTHLLKKRNLEVEACDISVNALKFLKDLSVPLHQKALPETGLKEKSYDWIFFLDALAYLPEKSQRLTLSEIQRLLKKEGHVVLSSPIDIHSYDAEENLLKLFSTEFTLIKKQESYHGLFLKLREVLKKTQYLSKACTQLPFKKQQMQKAAFVYKSLLYLTRFSLLKPFYKALASWAKKRQQALEKSLSTLKLLEKIAKFLSPKSPSHVIFLGKIRPLFDTQSPLSGDDNLKEDLYDKLYKKPLN